MSMGYWSGAKGQTMRGGNSASPDVKAGRQQYVTNAVMRNYTKEGGGFNTAPGSGRPVIPTYTDKWTGETRYTPEFENSLRNTLASFGNEDIGTGMTGSGASEKMDIDRALFNNRRNTAIDRASDRGWEEEKRNWQRESWKRSKDMMGKMSSGGGLSAGGNFRVSGV